MFEHFLFHFRDFMLAESTGVFLGVMAFFLAALYLSWAFIAPIYDLNTPRVKMLRLAARAANWLVFAVIFVFFDRFTAEFSIGIWRALARLSLFFIMLSEIAYHLGFIGIIWRKIKCKLTH